MHLLAMERCCQACPTCLALHTAELLIRHLCQPSVTDAQRAAGHCTLSDTCARWSRALNLRLATALASVSADSKKSVEGTAGTPREGVSESPSTPVVAPSAVAESSVSVLPACVRSKKPCAHSANAGVTHGRHSPQQSSSYSSRLQSRHFRLACARWGCCLPALRSAFCRATLAFFFSACLRWRSFLASASLTAAALCSRSLALSSSSDGGSALHSRHTLLLASGASCGYQSPACATGGRNIVV